MVNRRQLLKLLPVITAASVTNVEGRDLEHTTTEVDPAKHYLIVLKERQPKAIIHLFSEHLKAKGISATIVSGSDLDIYDIGAADINREIERLNRRIDKMMSRKD
jgi:hypothetical protein